jgi:hypothetical protein
MARLLQLLMVAVVVALGAETQSFADPRYPDWPCTQAKVPEISVTAVWAGPPLDDAEKAWVNDERVKDVVAQLVPRRVPIEQAQKVILEFVTGDAPAREERGTLLFAGLFDRLNHERTEVMNGIERLGRRLKELADKIRSDISELHKLQDQAKPDEPKLQELGNQVQWNTRIFEDRQKTVRYVCEVPVLIEQRLFALGRAVQQAME